MFSINTCSYPTNFNDIQINLFGAHIYVCSFIFNLYLDLDLNYAEAIICISAN